MADEIISNERPKIKAINFDLLTNQMKANGVYPDGYRTLGNSFVKYGFEHRQGSGYVSKHKLTSLQVFMIVQQITKENPWLKGCVNKMDVSDVQLTKQYDLTAIIQNTNTQKQEQAQEQKDQEQQPSAQINNDVAEKRSESADDALDLVTSTMFKCSNKIDQEIAQAAQAKNTQKEAAPQQVGQAQQARQVGQVQQVGQARQVGKGKQKTKSNNRSSGK